MSRSVSFWSFFAVLLFLLLALPVRQAEAQTSRLYFAGYMGLNSFSDLDFSESTAPINGSMEMDDTYSFAGALGLRLSQNLRIEAELSYRNSDLSEVNFTGSGTFAQSGEIESYLGLLNAYYDFDMGGSKIKPFVSAGLGFGWHDADINNDSGLAAVAVDDALNVMWQFGGGLKYRVSPTLAFSGGYRYLGGTDLELGSYDMEYGGHEFRIGLEYDLPVK